VERLIELGASIPASIGSIGGVFAVVEEGAPAILSQAVVNEATFARTFPWRLGWIVVAGWERACTARGGRRCYSRATVGNGETWA